LRGLRATGVELFHSALNDHFREGLVDRRPRQLYFSSTDTPIGSI
jgi:hypothetical protein